MTDIEQMLSELLGDDLEFADAVSRYEGSSDELQRLADLRGLKRALQNKQAPFIRNNPPSALKGSIGNQTNILPGDIKQVAAWVGEDAETLPITITTAAVLPVDLLFVQQYFNTYPFRPFAITRFGTRGTMVTVETDIGRGCQFTVGASSVTVELSSDTAQTVAGFSLPPAIAQLLSGMITFNQIVRTEQITRTVYTINNDDNITITYPIPAFAKQLKFVATGTGQVVTGNNPVLEFLDSCGTIVEFFDLSTILFTNFQTGVEKYTIPDDAVAFRVYLATGGLDNIEGRAIFDLAI